jgi:hypothetical protein
MVTASAAAVEIAVETALQNSNGPAFSTFGTDPQSVKNGARGGT